MRGLMIELYIEYEYWVAAIQLLLAMLGMGASLQVADFKKVALQPKAATIGLLMQLMAVPLIALGFILFTSLPPGIVIGIAIVAAIPGGTVSNIFTYMARGNVPLSISITALTSVACLVTTPLILDFLISEYMPDSFVMPVAQIATEIGLFLLLPLIVGMSILKRFPSYAEGFSTLCVRGSLLGIGLIVIGSVGAGRLNFSHVSGPEIATLLAFIASLSLAGIWLTKAFGLAKKDNSAIEMEVVVRNINLGLLLKVSLFPTVAGESNPMADMALFTMLLYGAWQLVTGIGLIFWRRRQADLA
ncbi:MAG: bile acid:sodium symporter family protein [Porticoccaceae bacterium]|nr:bile acid:sodium symporter family protein [Porticoccaceae bacterium]MBT5577791.1 bile acid:sodium symporter family protein [Porticoccaceae bacterium]MBT7375419.1 bile acid:sodium symporter family protein [Porticoccaceae bacterium]